MDARADADARPDPDDAGRAEVVRALGAARRIVCAGHLPLDGDGLGSALALAACLRDAGRDAVCLLGAEPPRNLRFLPGLDRALRMSDPLPFAPDLFVALDGSDLARFGPMADVARRAGRVAVIDHHVTNARFGDANFVSPAWAATGMMTDAVIRDLRLPFGRDAALCLYVALVTDTGRFSYSNTSPAAHEAAARYLALGVRPERVLRHVWRSQQPGRLALWSEGARRTRLAADGRLGWTVLTREMCERAGVDAEDVHDLVEIPMSLEGVEVAVLFRETTDGLHVSLRSDSDFDVAAFASARGGGGHRRAAGFSLSVPIGEAEERIPAELTREMARA
ncbi:MAG: Bifunctional oligoribonuclease and PAP phosphatase NrnA [Planctomycetes bacterium]|nr:Bifunctional oligoribonuclease and PAP phosphatase NrnA [Planctomycetota bacterium]